MELLPFAPEQGLIGSISHQCVLEDIFRVGRRPATEDKFRMRDSQDLAHALSCSSSDLASFKSNVSTPSNEPAIDRDEKIVSLMRFALVAPQPRLAHRRAQFQELCTLRTGNGEGTLEIRLGFCRIWL
jgi:hypothetical protein